MMRISGERSALAIVLGGFLLLQIPFLFVPFRVDEPNLLAIAEQIAADPFDPYGFEINWLGTPQPAWDVLRNPPLVPYWIALWGALFGWSEPLLHGAMVLWSVVALLAVARLARSVGMPGWMGAALLASSVIFFVSAPLLMPDVAALALAAVAVALALEEDAPALSAALAAAAAAPLAKYTAVAVVIPLTLLALRRPNRAWRIAVAVAPLLSLLVWSRISTMIYGQSHLFASAAAQGGLKIPAMPILVDLGLAVFPLGLLAIALVTRRMAVVAAISAGVAFMVLYVLTENRLDSALMGSLGAAAAVVVIAAGVRKVVEEPQVLRVAALAWLCAVMALAFGYQFMTSRYLLAASVAALLLIGGSSVPRLFGLALATGATLSVGVAATDAMQASIYPRIARSVITSAPERVWLAGHWGFQHYGMDAGGRMLDLQNPATLRPGDRVVVSSATFPNTSIEALMRQIPGERLETFVIHSRWPVRTQACGGTISLHGSGPSSCENAYRVAVPWGVSREPIEIIHQFRVGTAAAATTP